ncbi:MAG: flagellar hook-basal body complex protein FliE [Treponema sp.]|jgi:flagellar hook-basal body complex protein FliE|nr:flagellar hook-basal body complex protein FliE [Treponema sp.]
MIINAPQLIAVDPLPMHVRDPRHIGSSAHGVPTGQEIVALGDKIGAGAVTRGGSFEDAMLRALDTVSADQNKASAIIQTAITDPDSVDIHDVTIAQAKASMSLNITRTVLSRLVQGWRDLVNIR